MYSDKEYSSIFNIFSYQFALMIYLLIGRAQRPPAVKPVTNPKTERKPAISFFGPSTTSGPIMNKAVVANPLVKPNKAIFKKPNQAVLNTATEVGMAWRIKRASKTNLKITRPKIVHFVYIFLC